MDRKELIDKYVAFFKSKGHEEIPSSSLIPANDPTVLFTTAGMHPLVPFLTGQKHPLGKRLVNVQKCVRTTDIEEVGNKVHHTFFEMLGNWSLGDYFKKEAIEWSFEFLTSKKWLGIPVEELAVSCFGGDENAPRDEESASVWESLGVKKKRIAFLPKKNNWWGPAGEIGPCGPDTEMFYWTGKGKAPEKFDAEDSRWVEIWNDVFMEYEKKKKTILVDGMGCLYDKNFKLNDKLTEMLGKFNARKILVVNGFRKKGFETAKQIVNDAFSLEEKGIKKNNSLYFEELFSKFGLKSEEVIYFDHSEENVTGARSLGILSKVYKDEKDVEQFIEKNLYFYASLKQKNVDTGMGLERALAILRRIDDNYLTDVWEPIIKEIENLSGKKYWGNEKTMRVIADHVKASVFMIADGVLPGNTGRGYVLRRLIRRAIVKLKHLEIEGDRLVPLVDSIYHMYPDYKELEKNREKIYEILDAEEKKFDKTLDKGLSVFAKVTSGKKSVSGEESFLLFQSFGFPIELIEELAREKKIKVDVEGFDKEFKKHQELSRTLSAGNFKSGLVDNSAETTKLHTATHLLNESLRKVLGNDVRQRGSNINSERLRFDFNFSRKLTSEEIKKVEFIVNEKIRAGLDVKKEEISLDDALRSGAQAEFGAKYPRVVSVYTVIDGKDVRGWFSREICTGPHVKNTKEIGKFRIVKEEGVAAGVRRIKAVVE